MARDPRKNSAFESGMRGREKPKVNEAHGDNAVNDNPGGEMKQAAGKTIGQPGGVDHTDSAYSSGMRGMERPKQKAASGAANLEPGGNDAKAATGQRSGFEDAQVRKTPGMAQEMGADGNSTEEAAEGMDDEPEGILGEEDDTHINVRIPKASLKRKTGGASV